MDSYQTYTFVCNHALPCFILEKEGQQTVITSTSTAVYKTHPHAR